MKLFKASIKSQETGPSNRSNTCPKTIYCWFLPGLRVKKEHVEMCVKEEAFLIKQDARPFRIGRLKAQSPGEK